MDLRQRVELVYDNLPESMKVHTDDVAIGGGTPKHLVIDALENTLKTYFPQSHDMALVNSVVFYILSSHKRSS